MAMDKKYLDSLQHLAAAMEELVDSLRDKESKSQEARGSQVGDLNVSLVMIAEGIEEIKEQNTEMLAKQDTIIALSKDIKAQKESKGLLSGMKGQGKSLKEGAKTIVLMAGAILAVGLAFKIIGGVDFASVIALAIALPLIALAFKEISEMKGISSKEIVKLGFVVVTMAASIMISSWLLALISPPDLSQLVAAIGIAAMFVVISYGIEKMVNGIRKVKPKDVMMLPLVLVTMSLAIVASSWIIQGMAPISLVQMLTMIGLSLSLTIAAIAIGVAMKFMAKMPIKELLMGGLGVIVASGVIMLSSHLLAAGTYSKYPGLGWVLGTAVGVMGFALPMVALGIIAMSGVGALAIAAGGAMVLLVAATMVATSHILQSGDYSGGPTVGWSLGTGLAMIPFGMAMVTLGTIIIASFGLGALAMLAGKEAVLMVASTIVETAAVLKGGDFSGGPTVGWTLGTGLAMLPFGVAIVTLGTMIVASFGLGGLAMLAGKEAVLMVASTIVKTAEILKGGDYSGGPTVGWTLGTGLALLPFGTAIVTLGTMIVASFGLGAVAMLAGAGAVLVVASTIVETSKILNKGEYTGGPTSAWTSGAASSMIPFGRAIVKLGMILAPLNVFGGAGDAVMDTGANVMKKIAQSIVDVSFILQGGSYTGGPNKEWSEGIGLAIGGFAPVFSMLDESLGDKIMGAIFGKTDKTKGMVDAMIAISNAIISVATIFNSSSTAFDDSKVPSKDWATSVSSLISSFTQAFAIIEDEGLDAKDITEGTEILGLIAESIMTVGAKFESDKIENVNKASTSISNLAESYMKLAEAMESLSGGMEGIADLGLNIDGGLVFTNEWHQEGVIEKQSVVKHESVQNVEVTKEAGAEETGKTLDDIYNQMENMNAQLGVIAGNSSNLSEYIDELRTQSDVEIKH